LSRHALDAFGQADRAIRARALLGARTQLIGMTMGLSKQALSHCRIEHVAILLAGWARAAATTSRHVCMDDLAGWAGGRLVPRGLVAVMLASRDFKGIRRKRLPIFMLGADHAFQDPMGRWIATGTLAE
jgi:hypothetical protein